MSAEFPGKSSLLAFFLGRQTSLGLFNLSHRKLEPSQWKLVLCEDEVEAPPAQFQLSQGKFAVLEKNG